VGAAVLVVAAGFFIWRGEAKPPPAAPAPPSAEAPARAWTRAAAPHHADSVEEPSPAKSQGVRFIKDLFADATDVCPNEPITVLVAASDDRPNPLPLFVKVNGMDGTSGVVSFPAPGDQPIVVMADDKRGTFELRKIHVHVRECPGFRVVRVSALPVASRPGVYNLIATPLFARNECARGGIVDPACDSKPDPSDTLRYEWDFGDGTTGGTNDGFVAHDFSERPQDAVQSSFVVRVTLTSRIFGELQGLTAVSVPNLAYQNKVTTGIITPEATTGPVAKTPTGYAFPVRFRNHEASAIRLTSAKASLIPCEPSEAPSTYDLSAAEILDSTTLPPGNSETTANLRGNLAKPGYCATKIFFEGTARGNEPVQTSLGALLEPPKRVRLDPDDPRVRTMREAMGLLGRDGGTVSEEEILVLRQRGLLK
jgi:hypothetical protein